MRLVMNVLAVLLTLGVILLSADVFRRGKWEPETPAVSNSLPFDDLWPGATQYARTMLPLDARWARVRLHARGLVGTKDGATVHGVTEVSSDAFEIPALK